jgi:hypothetical protein
VSATAVIEAIAVASGYSQSVVSFGTYIIGSLPASMPLLIALSPGGAKIGGGSFMLTVNGANFVPGSMVRWNGAARTTTYMNGTQLQATILASDIAREGTGLVTVANPTPTAATSPAQPIAVVSGAPAANITSGSISDTADGSGNHTLTLTGTDFVSGSTVNWNGAGLLTTYVSPWQIGATLPAADSGSAATVTVVNPAPGGTSAGFVLP